MKIIDNDNYAASGIETMFFPGGEPHVKIPLIKEIHPLLYLKLRTWNDVGFAICVNSALCAQGLEPHVFIPYFPGARQDKTDGTAPLTVAVMAETLNFYPLMVFDPHSEKLSEWLNFREFMPKNLLLPIKEDVVGIIAPDEGATSRAKSFLHKFYPKAELIQCYKKRDPHSGKLSNYVMERLSTKGRYIIVDDICDGGGTFNLLTKSFEADPISKYCSLEMFVSHGIFSKGLDAINSRIECITTTDSWCQLSGNSRLTVIPLLPNLIDQLGD